MPENWLYTELMLFPCKFSDDEVVKGKMQHLSMVFGVAIISPWKINRILTAYLIRIEGLD